MPRSSSASRSILSSEFSVGFGVPSEAFGLGWFSLISPGGPIIECGSWCYNGNDKGPNYSHITAASLVSIKCQGECAYETSTGEHPHEPLGIVVPQKNLPRTPMK